MSCVHTTSPMERDIEASKVAKVTPAARSSMEEG